VLAVTTINLQTVALALSQIALSVRTDTCVKQECRDKDCLVFNSSFNRVFFIILITLQCSDKDMRECTVRSEQNIYSGSTLVLQPRRN